MTEHGTPDWPESDFNDPEWARDLDQAVKRLAQAIEDDTLASLYSGDHNP
jgi:hypothetical protein